MLEVGTKAPDFSLPDQNGDMHTLSEYKGKKVVLYFYPRDNTAGCTKQACGFGALYPQFTEKGAVVIGVSKDSVKSHKNFETKYELPFTLLSDPELTAMTYGMRRSCMGRSPTASSAPRTLLTRMGSSSRPKKK